MTMLNISKTLIGTIDADSRALKSQENLKLGYLYGVSKSNVTIPTGACFEITVQLYRDRQKGVGMVTNTLAEQTLLTPRRIKAHEQNVRKLIEVLNTDGTEWSVQTVAVIFAPVRLYILISNGEKEIVYRSKNGMSNGTGVTEVVGERGQMKNSEASVPPQEWYDSTVRSIEIEQSMETRYHARVAEYLEAGNSDCVDYYRRCLEDTVARLAKSRALIRQWNEAGVVEPAVRSII